MKKHTLLFISFSILVFHCQGQKKEEYDNSLLEQWPHHIKLSWETSPENSQAVSWRTRATEPKSYIEYVEATASPFFEERIKKIEATSRSHTSDDGLWYYHSANLQDLQPNTQYSYRVGHKDQWSEWSEFKTATGQNEPFKFLYFGDVQRYIHSLGSRTLRQAVLANPDAKFMLFAGDLIHRGGLNKENWNEFFPAAGWAFQNIPIIATPGNHEHKWETKETKEIAPLWNLNFCFSKNGPDGQEEQTYFVDYNNIRVISLDTSAKITPAQWQETYVWLEKALKEFKGDWVFVTFHHAMAGLARNRNPDIRFPEIKALLEKYKVPMVLTGHEHLYARGSMDAAFPIHVVSVAGPYQNAIQFSDWVERAGTSIQLYQEIYVSENKLEYVAKTVLGEVYDAFTITKDTSGEMQFEEAVDLPAESLLPTKDFEKRYDKELVKTYEADKTEYLQRKKQ
ncbi:FN3 domain-containing metallophosphoesterase family protein [Maribacter sp. PR1]|uniref:FN3 domain-containing metallophosphoesterase family protein n=1 Tax=Maribacter cobaltidurans TaxID=1178778 RepID=A0ABU7IXW5_9FLAO|nr:MULTISPECIES: FN3 domain-containing metallophosphoesterase family protein [Maribacter]MDC6390426.1 FN3 domain-containing metallophosphoesterase family protein [Maribacter sp. PR1]MEE1977815.1 FN3 domain-containing metallophosphoesterase family protein [Maribacter cobaltidurans]|tara:strand:+ start:8064 stop:9422 length:1359 start_codon:yes stop_codon:yes gene_type:complete